MAAPSELYLVRHAIAEPRGEAWPDDEKRPLTARGMSRFKEAVAGLRTLDVALEEIFTSPLIRARQTADILAAGLPGAPPVKVLQALAPGHAPAAVLAQLARAGRRPRIALVGHEPGMGALAAYLIGAGRPLQFKKGAVCRIDIESLTARRGGTLAWCVPPRLLRGLAS